MQTHTVVTGGALLLSLFLVFLPVSLQLLQIGLQLGDAFAQSVLIQQTVSELQLQAVTAAQSLPTTQTSSKHACDKIFTLKKRR